MSVLRLEQEFRPLSAQVALAEAISGVEQAGLTVVSTVEGDLEQLPTAVSDIFARIIKECGNNMERHAHRGGPCTILVHIDADSVEAAFVNGWEGRQGRGLGLAGIRERAEAIDGRVRVHARNGTWSIHIWLPYSAESRSRPSA